MRCGHLKTIVGLMLLLVIGTVLAAPPVSINQTVGVFKDSRGLAVAFPDVCKTPTPGGPVPIPYPNIAMSSDYSRGAKQTKTGETILIKPTSVRTAQGDEVGAYEVSVLGRDGRPIPLSRSRLFQMRDGSYCAVCMQGGRITRVLRLRPAATR